MKKKVAAKTGIHGAFAATGSYLNPSPEEVEYVGDP